VEGREKTKTVNWQNALPPSLCFVTCSLSFRRAKLSVRGIPIALALGFSSLAIVWKRNYFPSFFYRVTSVIFLFFDYPREKKYFKANFLIENSRFSSLLSAWDVSPGESLFWPILIPRPRLTCSAGVFFGRANVLIAKAHVETRKEGRKWGESKNNSMNMNKQLSPAQNTPTLQTRPRTKNRYSTVFTFVQVKCPFKNLEIGEIVS